AAIAAGPEGGAVTGPAVDVRPRALGSGGEVVGAYAGRVDHAQRLRLGEEGLHLGRVGDEALVQVGDARREAVGAEEPRALVHHEIAGQLDPESGLPR